MYIVKNNKDSVVMVHLMDHSRMWNDRIHTPISAGGETTIEDEQLSPELVGMAKKKIIELTHVDDAPVVEVVPTVDLHVEEKPYISKYKKKAVDTDTKPNNE